jgi:hypothetical protein
MKRRIAAGEGMSRTPALQAGAGLAVPRTRTARNGAASAPSTSKLILKAVRILQNFNFKQQFDLLPALRFQCCRFLLETLGAVRQD